MANGHGGYRRPTNPAPVSGPGALSRRTDGKQPVMDLPNAGYGEQADFHAIQSGAPLAQAPGVPSAPTPAGGPPSLTPLDAPTARPGEPVTAGAPMGPGPGPESLGLPDPNADTPADLQRLRAYLPAFIEMAARPDASQSFRAAVKTMVARLRGAS